MNAVALVLATCICLSASADPLPEGAPVQDALSARQAPSAWTGGAAVLFGAGALPGDYIVTYADFGKRLNRDLAAVLVFNGEFGITEQPADLLSGGLGLRVIGDGLGGLAAPLEVTVGGGVTTTVRGETPYGAAPMGMVFIDTIFPLIWNVRVHSQLMEHIPVNATVFLTASLGLGLTFE